MECRIALVNMPFARRGSPSIALAQLRSRVTRRFQHQVAVDIVDANHDFAAHLGVELYDYIVEQSTNGLGDWLCRPAAFPDAPDDPDDYLSRYYPRRGQQAVTMRTKLIDGRLAVIGLLVDCIRRYQLSAYDVVGFTSMFSQTVACFALARLLKQKAPTIATAMGGANCEGSMGVEIVRNVEAIDYVFSGPALVSFPEVIGRILAGRPPGNLDVDGVFSRRASTAVAASGPMPGADRRQLGRDLPMDVHVPVDYSQFVERFTRTFGDGVTQLALPFETSRGCWWGERSHCTFCGLNGSTMGYRAMAPDDAATHIRELIDRYPDCRLFTAVDNIMPRDYPTAVFASLDVPDDVRIFYEVKADLGEERLRDLARGGVRRLQPGIESLNTSTLKLMRKGTTAFQNIRFLLGCAEFGIEPLWNLLVGFPGEEGSVFAKYAQDIPSLTHLPPPTGVYPVRFDRFAPYFVHPEEYGLELEPMDFYRLVFPFPEDSLARFAYYFVDRRPGPYFDAMCEWIDPVSAAVRGWQSLWTTWSRPALRWDLARISDSRSGTVLELDVSACESALLDACRRPQSIRILERHLAADWSSAEVAEALQSLRERRLVFEESDRAMSLVTG